MKKEIISTKKAPSAIGPYSQGMIVGDYIFTSGQIPLNPENGQLVKSFSCIRSSRKFIRKSN